MSDSKDIRRGVESNESIELFEYIRQQIAEDSLLEFHKPRPLALFTGRLAMKYHWDPDTDALWHVLARMGATHIILPKYITATAQSIVQPFGVPARTSCGSGSAGLHPTW
jgi:hypothetical protein